MAELKEYAGGCHCGKVRYEVKLELDKVIECNCSHCSRKGFLWTYTPADQFTLLRGMEALNEYRFNKKTLRHVFCSQCGVQSYMTGGKKDGVATVGINVRCLEGVDVTKLEIVQVDGRRY